MFVVGTVTPCPKGLVIEKSATRNSPTVAYRALTRAEEAKGRTERTVEDLIVKDYGTIEAELEGVGALDLCLRHLNLNTKNKAPTIPTAVAPPTKYSKYDISGPANWSWTECFP